MLAGVAQEWAHQAPPLTAFVAVDVASDALIKEARLAPRNFRNIRAHSSPYKATTDAPLCFFWHRS